MQGRDVEEHRKNERGIEMENEVDVKCGICGKRFIPFSKRHGVCSNECRYVDLVMKRSMENKEGIEGKIRNLELALKLIDDGTIGCMFCGNKYAGVFFIKGEPYKMCYWCKDKLKRKYKSKVVQMKSDTDMGKGGEFKNAELCAGENEADKSQGQVGEMPGV